MTQPNDTIPVGLCQCGCGLETPVSKYTDKRGGTVKGQPTRYIKGHIKKTAAPDYVVEPATECWIWQRRLNDNGYGSINIGGRRYSAHRYYFEKFKGAIPDGLVIDHQCPHGPNRACVNPDHLFAVTQAVNSQRGKNAKLNRQKAETMRLLRQHGMLLREIAELFGVAESLVSVIVRDQKWLPELPGAG